MPITLRNTIQKGLIGNEWSVPTIYIDSDTEEIVKSTKVVAIGVEGADNSTLLPKNTTVIQVGTNVTEVHDIQVQDNIIPENIFKYAINVINFNRAFIYTDIKKIPDGLFDNCTKATDFTFTFYDCKNIETIPEGLFDNCPQTRSFIGTFNGCKNLKSIPAGLFDHCVNAQTFMGAFAMCDNLSSIPDGLFSHCSNVFNFNNTFLECKHIDQIPTDLFEHCTNVTDFYSTFEGCSRLTSVPKGLFDGCPSATSFENTFKGCSSLKSVPEDLFQNNPQVTNFRDTFKNCFLLEETMPVVKAPSGKKYKLWELDQIYPVTIKGAIKGNGCFHNCTRLPGYEKIPDEWSVQ